MLCSYSVRNWEILYTTCYSCSNVNNHFPNILTPNVRKLNKTTSVIDWPIFLSKKCLILMMLRLEFSDNNYVPFIGRGVIFCDNVLENVMCFT